MELVTMKTKRITVTILFLLLATEAGTLARAQVVVQPVEANLGPVDGDVPSDVIGEKAGCFASCSPCPCVYGYAEDLFLQRSNHSVDQPVIVQAIDGIPVATFLSTSNLGFDVDPALRFVVGHRLQNGWTIEGSYLGLYSDASASVAPPDANTNLTFPGGLGSSNVFGDLNRVKVDYSSILNSAEINLLCCCGCCSVCGESKSDCDAKGDCGGGNLHCRTFDWFVGFRYVNLGERFRIYGERDQTTGGGTTAVESGVYDIRTRNSLFGSQLGARVRRWGNRLGWEATGKAGIFGNDAQQEQYVIDYDKFELRPTTGAARGQVAFVGELNLTGIYRLTEV